MRIRSSTIVSSSCASSIENPYWNPEHPPPVTYTRTNLLSNSQVNSFACARAVSVRISACGVNVSTVNLFFPPLYSIPDLVKDIEHSGIDYHCCP